MTTEPVSLRKGPLFLVPLVLLLMGGCFSLSREVVDRTAGLNGGFEISKDGLPVNWSFYTPSSADFDVILDGEIFKEGRQSLKFEVRRCSSDGGSRSPGWTNEFIHIGKYPGEGRYKVSFWIRNAGTEYAINAGGVSTHTGDMRTLIREDQNIDDWRLQEYEIEVAEGHWLRMELSIYQPGSFWIDDLRIQRVQH